jgi:kynurenine formamidase
MEVIDLSAPITEDMDAWPGDVPVRLWRHHTLAEGSPNVGGITLGTHTGTHLDAPFHWFEEGATVERIPLSRMVGEARVVDLRDRSDPATVSLAELQAAAGEVEEGERVLLLTGWRGRIGDQDHPALSPEAITWLAGRRPALVGIDTPSVDPPGAGYAHGALLGAEIAVIELLCNLQALVGETFLLAALPLPVVGLDGAPVRAVALRGLS